MELIRNYNSFVGDIHLLSIYNVWSVIRYSVCMTRNEMNENEKRVFYFQTYRWEFVYYEYCAIQSCVCYTSNRSDFSGIQQKNWTIFSLGSSQPIMSQRLMLSIITQNSSETRAVHSANSTELCTVHPNGPHHAQAKHCSFNGKRNWMLVIREHYLRQDGCK